MTIQVLVAVWISQVRRVSDLSSSTCTDILFALVIYHPLGHSLLIHCLADPPTMAKYTRLKKYNLHSDLYFKCLFSKLPIVCKIPDKRIKR